MRLHDALVDAGFDVEDEVQVGTYSLDCYVREWHLGFEADGPVHGRAFQRRRDAKRDAWLLGTAGIPLLRVSYERLGQTPDETLGDDIRDFIDRHAASVHERRRLAEATLGGL